MNATTDYAGRRFLIIRHRASGFVRCIVEGDRSGHSVMIQDWNRPLMLGVTMTLWDASLTRSASIMTPDPPRPHVASCALAAVLACIGTGGSPVIGCDERCIVEALGYEVSDRVADDYCVTMRASIGTCTQRCWHNGCTHPSPMWQAAWHDPCNTGSPGLLLAQFSDHQSMAISKLIA